MMNLADFARKLGAASVALHESTNSALEKAAKILEDEAKSAIATYKYGWAPLAESTLAHKSGDTPLLETGQLQGSIEHTLGDREAWVGTSDRTAIFHELGTSKMPARPFMGGALMAKEGELKREFVEIAAKAFTK